MTKLLVDQDAQSIGDGYCPDCGHRGFVLGPKGGKMRNIECGNITCRARFNVMLEFSTTGLFAFGHRIERAIEGGATNWGIPREAKPWRLTHVRSRSRLTH